MITGAISQVQSIFFSDKLCPCAREIGVGAGAAQQPDGGHRCVQAAPQQHLQAGGIDGAVGAEWGDREGREEREDVACLASHLCVMFVSRAGVVVWARSKGRHWVESDTRYQVGANSRVAIQ